LDQSNWSFRPTADHHPTLELPRSSVKSRRSNQIWRNHILEGSAVLTKQKLLERAILGISERSLTFAAWRIHASANQDQPIDQLVVRFMEFALLFESRHSKVILLPGH